ncbi:cellulase family glycosylhydrolase [Halomicrobium salinisoli]|uniref:cellulase family glycosylhydrolase n=1 Tax=Halomicrobium salinisoli TaxID=2878391 RepID=UPI001CEFFD23|nr:cellulase family glycosylhydrolase [Halomicrobium salinisoli]
MAREPRGGRGSTRRTFLRATGVGAALAVGGTGLAGVGSAQSDEGIPTPWLERDGKWLKDPEGNEVVLRGVNIADPARLNDDNRRYHVTAEQVTKWALSESDGWYNRILRIPCQPGDIVGADTGSVPPGEMTQSDVESYIETHLRPVVDICKEQGAYCIVDYHRHHDGQLRYTDDALDEEVRMFWETMAPVFAEESHVLYEVYNEPIAPYPGHNSYGQDGGVDVTDPEAEDTWLTWREAAQPWVDTIREHAPRNVVIVGSPRWTQWTYWASEHEFEGDNLAYAGHVYAHENLRPLSEYFGTPAEEVPVFMTEFGYDDEGQDYLKGTTPVEGQQFRDFFEEYENVHWQVWCFDPRWEPAMFDSDHQGTWTILEGEDFHGQFFKDYLAEKRDDRIPGGAGTTPDDGTPPTAPTDLSVASTTTTTATVEWSPSTDEGGSGLAEYVVAVDDREVAVPAGTTSATVEQLSPDTEYEVSVAAVDGAGNRSPATATTAVTVSDDDTISGPPSVGDADARPTDPDDDGRYEDLNGNGEVDYADVVLYFENMDQSAMTSATAAYDYNGNGELDFADLVDLFGQVQ